MIHEYDMDREQVVQNMCTKLNIFKLLLHQLRVKFTHISTCSFKLYEKTLHDEKSVKFKPEKILENQGDCLCQQETHNDKIKIILTKTEINRKRHISRKQI